MLLLLMKIVYLFIHIIKQGSQYEFGACLDSDFEINYGFTTKFSTK